MDAYGKKELLDFYDRHLEKFGDAPQALRWTGTGQEIRYRELVDIASPLEGRSILDYGCGKGDFLTFLKEQGIDAAYTGADVNANLIGLARKKHPDGDFVCGSVEEGVFDRHFDVVIICGVFNLRVAGIAASLRKSLKKLFALSRESLHLNIPSSLTKHKDPDMYYAEPDELLRFALDELSPRVTLRHGPVKNEIFLSVYRQPPRA